MNTIKRKATHKRVTTDPITSLYITPPRNVYVLFKSAAALNAAALTWAAKIRKSTSVLGHHFLNGLAYRCVYINLVNGKIDADFTGP